MLTIRAQTSSEMCRDTEMNDGGIVNIET